MAECASLRQRRRLGHPAEWWRQFETDLAAVDRALELEQQAAIAAGQPRPPKSTAQAKTTHAEATAVIARPRRDGRLPEPNKAAFAPQHEPGGRSARLDALQVRADEAVHRIAAADAALHARAQYTVRCAREAQTQAEPVTQRQAEASDGIEIEL